MLAVVCVCGDHCFFRFLEECFRDFIMRSTHVSMYVCMRLLSTFSLLLWHICNTQQRYSQHSTSAQTMDREQTGCITVLANHNPRSMNTDFQSLMSCGHFVTNAILLPLHPLNGLFSRTTWVSQYQKGKTNLDLNEERDDGGFGIQWHQLDHMQTICSTQITRPTPRHSIFTGRMLFLMPNQQCQSTEGTHSQKIKVKSQLIEKVEWKKWTDGHDRLQYPAD